MGKKGPNPSPGAGIKKPPPPPGPPLKTTGNNIYVNRLLSASLDLNKQLKEQLEYYVGLEKKDGNFTGVSDGLIKQVDLLLSRSGR